MHSELAWAQALREQAGLCTPVPLPATDGRTVVDLAGPGGVRHLVRFAAVPGREPAPDALGEHAGRLGAIAATMHTHATGWCPPAGFTRFRWDLPAILGSKPRWGRWQDGIGVGRDEAHVLGRAADLVSDRLLDYGCGPDRFGLVHADMRLANLIVDGDRIAVIDFDDCGYSWFLFDLAATLSFVEDDPRVPSWCQDWLAGYARVRPLPPRADTLAATFVLLRRLMLLGWLASHAGIALSAELGAGFTVGSCELAERYLDAG